MLSAEKKAGAATVVQINGSRLDAAVAGNFKDQMRDLVDKGERYLIVDLSPIHFMDSSGLGALVGALKYMGREGRVELACPGEAVMKVLRLTRMNKVFTIHETMPPA